MLAVSANYLVLRTILSLTQCSPLDTKNGVDVFGLSTFGDGLLLFLMGHRVSNV